ncbi:MAG: hypothetical protein JWM36_2118 [Hyphomicrobiales bacterium]|nr:hypothetical protein [Hyphomicrobiales bacterium]
MLEDFDTDWLVEILLPLTHNDGSPVDQDVMSAIRQELVDRFGGLTAFTRSPAEGVWTSAAGDSRDDIVVLEVMARGLDRPWWGAWRIRLEALLSQEEVVIRATRLERL